METRNTWSLWSWNLFYVASWFSFSTLLSIFNKQLVGRGVDQWHFPYPILLCAAQAFCHSLISCVLVHLFSYPRPASALPKLPLRTFLSSVGFAGFCTAVDISLSNYSFAFVTLSFYTMIKSTVPIWVLLFAFTFGLEVPNAHLVWIILIIVLGVILTVAGETSFHLFGFVLVLAASISSGLRWAVTQLLLQKDKLDHPIITLYYLSPTMTAFQLIGSLIFERPSFDSPQFAKFELYNTIGLMGFGALLAYAMMVSEFHLVKSTSVVTLSVCGMAKELLTISLAVVVFSDTLTYMNYAGLFVTLLGIGLYHRYKASDRYSPIKMEKIEEGRTD